MPTTREVRSSDGTPIGVHTVGSGEPLVMVPGAWASADHWLGVAGELAQTNECWVLDRRARGASGDGDGYSFDREIEDITAVLEAAGPGADLLGHSSGAIYTLETARRIPVERLILYEPPLRWAERGDPADLVDRIRALVDDDRLEDAAELFFREEGRLDDEALAMLKTLPDWESMVPLAPICVREWDAILNAHLSVDRYRDVSCPTLLLAGSENLDHPSMATEPLAATLPDARVAMLDGHAHMAHRADPALVATRVRTFIDDADRR
jgi:pimeloyl-ACP methyl ester carboxylesterase